MSRRLIPFGYNVSKPQEDGDRLILWACIEEGEATPEVQLERLSILRAVLARADAEIAKEEQT